jgi:colanic acid biosynthesis protein WcaH
MKLNAEEFLQVIRLSPLFSIDLVVVNEERELLVGKRMNAPAKGWWFVPGGRVYKNEPLNEAFSRISNAELGQKIEMKDCQLLGVFEHFYDDCALNEKVSTHYINSPYLVKVKKATVDAPNIQHESYRWVSLDKVETDLTIHEYSKAFLAALLATLKNGKP